MGGEGLGTPEHRTASTGSGSQGSGGQGRIDADLQTGHREEGRGPSSTGRSERSTPSRRPEPASGSRDPAPTIGNTMAVPNLSQPMSTDTAINLWRHLLYDRENFGPELIGNGRIPTNFLPRRMLQNASAHPEMMSQQNRPVSTCALVRAQSNFGHGRCYSSYDSGC